MKELKAYTLNFFAVLGAKALNCKKYKKDENTVKVVLYMGARNFSSFF